MIPALTMLLALAAFVLAGFVLRKIATAGDAESARQLAELRRNKRRPPGRKRSGPLDKYGRAEAWRLGE